MSLTLYGLTFDKLDDQAMVEMEMIRAGGFMQVEGKTYGLGLFHHYRTLQTLLWPEGEDHHRWSDLALLEILENRITVCAGSKDSGKTHVCSRFVITDYFVFPHDTLALVSSTEGRGAELRVYGDLKDLHRRAQELRPWLPGQVVDSLKVISTDVLDKSNRTRDLRKGIAWIPIPKGDDDYLGGLRTFVGVKQKRRRLMGDELQFCPSGYMDVLANLDKGEFKGIFMGNFIGKGDPLDRMSEPECGWANQPEPTKTSVWNNRLGGRTVNFVGTDSPNFDPPETLAPRFPYLIDRGDVDRVTKRYGQNSLQFYSQIKGVRKPDIMARRVLTMDICRSAGAFGPCVWTGTPRTKVYALDCAFGGDRAVGGMVEFGQEVNGATVIKVHQPREIPIDLTLNITPEEQLAHATKRDCDALGIPDAHVYFDAGMRAMVGVHMANIVGRGVNAVNFGGMATPRPVSATDFIYDEKLRAKRLKRCDEAYVKFVTELAFAVRLTVESRQIREMPESVVREFELREWMDAPGGKVELETKAETKKRMGQSPDLADWCFVSGTLVSTPNGEVPIEKLVVGDEVVTPLGITTVHKLRRRQVGNIFRLETTNGKRLVGTGDHKIFTFDRGWVRMDCLGIDNEMETVENIPLWLHENSSIGETTSTGFRAMVDIIHATKGRVERKDFFTGLYGRRSTGQSLKECAFTIKMETGMTTESTISRSSILLITPDFTSCLDSKIPPSGNSRLRLLSQKPFQHPGLGTGPSKVGRGIVKIPGDSGDFLESQWTLNAWSAGKSLRRGFPAGLCFVLTPALVEGPQGKISTSKPLAAYAPKYSSRTSIDLQRPVPKSVERLSGTETVYNLTLEEHNAYYANGILVANCEIAVEGARRLGFQISGLDGIDGSLSDDREWLDKELGKFRTFKKRHEINYRA